MIRIKLKYLLNEKEFIEERKITLEEVSQKTGISKATLSRVSSINGYNLSAN